MEHNHNIVKGNMYVCERGVTGARIATRSRKEYVVYRSRCLQSRHALPLRNLLMCFREMQLTPILWRMRDMSIVIDLFFLTLA